MQLISICLLLLTAVSPLCAQALSAGRYEVKVAPTGALSVAHGGAVVVRDEMLQLVDNTQGWKPLFWYGKGKPAIERRDATHLSVCESVPGVMEYRKEASVGEGGVEWRIEWRFPAGTGAQWCYYFLDIPAEALAGAACEYDAGDGPTAGELPGSVGLMAGLKWVCFYAGDQRVRFDLEARNATWKLTDWSGTEHKSYRLRIEERAEAGLDASAGVRLSVAPSSAAEVTAMKERARVRAETARREALAALGMVCRKPLRLGTVRASTASPKRGGKVELSFDLEGTFDNPFDPEEIDVTGEFRTPDGRTEAVPAFFHVPVRLDKDGRLLGYGEPGWKVRYTPVRAGAYTYRVRARNGEEKTESAPGTFQCREAEFEGFVRVSKKQSAALGLDSGKPYLPVGVNLFDGAFLGRPYPDHRLGRLTTTLNRLADAGGNFVRLRADSWWLGIEGKADERLGHLGPGFYNQRACDEIDRIYEAAEKRGVRVMHCLYNANGMVNGFGAPGGPNAWRRAYAFYLKENGGSCDDTAQFWTDPDALRWVRMRLRYSVARWGYSPSLMSWEFWNELVIHAGLEEKQVAWHREMARYLRGVDPWRHPITNSLMPEDFDRHDALWRLPEMEIVQYHSYRGSELPVHVSRLAEECVRRWGKPFFLGESGIIHPDGAQGSYPYDPDGLHLHNGLWAPLFGGASGSGAFWFVHGYLEPQGLYRHYRALTEWARDVPWNAPGMKAATVERVLTEKPSFADSPVPAGSGARIGKAGAERFVVDPETGKVGNGKHFQSMLHVSDERKTRPTLVLECGTDASLEVRVVRSVGNETNRLTVTLDGKTFLEEPYPAGEKHGTSRKYVEQYDNWLCDYDDVVRVPLSKGRHEVTLEAFGKDRIEIECTLRSYFRFPPVVVTGRQAGGNAWLWARHRSSTAWNLREGKTWEPVRGARAVLTGFPDGRYRVEWYDTWKGAFLRADEAEARAGRLTVALPDLHRDLAAKVRPAP